MEKTINDYINELKNLEKRSKFKNEEKTETNSKKQIGYLEISASHSQNTFPVPDAKFTIEDKNGNIVYEGKTDASGKFKKIPLNAIPKSLTEEPGTNFINSAVFYDVTITADNYIPFTIKNIPIFENITTLQNFDLTFFAASPNAAPQIISLPTENNL